jgi:hypothetical protein
MDRLHWKLFHVIIKLRDPLPLYIWAVENRIFFGGEGVLKRRVTAVVELGFGVVGGRGGAQQPSVIEEVGGVGLTGSGRRRSRGAALATGVRQGLRERLAGGEVEARTLYLTLGWRRLKLKTEVDCMRMKTEVVARSA